MRMQEHPLKPHSVEPRVEFAVPVTVVTRYRVPRMRRLNADLVRAARAERDFDKRRFGADALDQPELACRQLPAAANGNSRFSFAVCPHQWNFDTRRSFRPGSHEQCEVSLVDTALAQKRMQAAQRAAALRDEQAARGFAVQTMRELELRKLGTQASHRFDTAKRNAAAAVNRKAHRLVEDDQTRVLVDDALLEPLQPTRLELR
jgi:hypothetical protein